MKMNAKDGLMTLGGAVAGFAIGSLVSKNVCKSCDTYVKDGVISAIGLVGSLFLENKTAQVASAGLATAGLVKVLNRTNVETPYFDLTPTVKSSSDTLEGIRRRNRKLGVLPVMPANSNRIDMPRRIPVQNPVAGVMAPGMGRVLAPGMGKCIGGCY